MKLTFAILESYEFSVLQLASNFIGCQTNCIVRWFEKGKTNSTPLAQVVNARDFSHIKNEPRS